MSVHHAPATEEWLTTPSTDPPWPYDPSIFPPTPDFSNTAPPPSTIDSLDPSSPLPAPPTDPADPFPHTLHQQDTLPYHPHPGDPHPLSPTSIPLIRQSRLNHFLRLRSRISPLLIQTYTSAIQAGAATLLKRSRNLTWPSRAVRDAHFAAISAARDALDAEHAAFATLFVQQKGPFDDFARGQRKPIGPGVMAVLLSEYRPHDGIGAGARLSVADNAITKANNAAVKVLLGRHGAALYFAQRKWLISEGFATNDGEARRGVPRRAAQVGYMEGLRRAKKKANLSRGVRGGEGGGEMTLEKDAREGGVGKEVGGYDGSFGGGAQQQHGESQQNYFCAIEAANPGQDHRQEQGQQLKTQQYQYQEQQQRAAIQHYQHAGLTFNTHIDTHVFQPSQNWPPFQPVQATEPSIPAENTNAPQCYVEEPIENSFPTSDEHFLSLLIAEIEAHDKTSARPRSELVENSLQ